MKFGEKFDLQRLPLWDSYYLPYAQLKTLMKLAIAQAAHSNSELDLKDFYTCLNHGIATLDAFLHDHYAFLSCKEQSFYSFYETDFLSSPLSRLELLGRSELQDICAISAELREEYSELQWFSRLNQEATSRIYSKLQKVNDTLVQHECFTRLLEKTRHCETKCLEQIERLLALINDISRASLLPQPEAHSIDLSQRLKMNDDKIPGTASYLTLIGRYIIADQASDCLDVFGKVYSLSNSGPAEQSSFFYKVLVLSVSCQAWLCAKTLVTEFKQLCYPINFDFLNYLIGFIGRNCHHDDDDDNATYENISLRSLSPNCKDAGIDLLLHIVENVRLGNQDVLQRKDDLGRHPLHYAAIYGLTTVCGIIIQYLHKLHGDSFTNRDAILDTDDEGFTPLLWAVIRGHVEITKLFLTLLKDDIDTANKASNQELSTTMSKLLFIALKFENDDIVRLLVSSNVDINYQSINGETVLHLAAQLGREDYVNMLLEISSHQNADINIRENARGWTPLFIASARGYLPLVERLLSAGADMTLSDYLGWTAKEHAAFRGHLPTAERLTSNTVANVPRGLCHTSWGGRATPKYNLQGDCSYVLINLGVMQRGKTPKRTDLKYLGSELHSKQSDAAFSLELSMPSDKTTSHLLRLPYLGDAIDDTFVFPVEDLSDTRLVFKIFLAKSKLGLKGKLVGSGTVLLRNDEDRFGAQRQSLIRENVVSILETGTMKFLGTVTFTYVLATPFPHLHAPTPSIAYLEKLESVQLIGHRGLGQNVDGREHLQLGENTMQSFLSAAQLGASHVEFGNGNTPEFNDCSHKYLYNCADVQVTRDLVPVLYHDFSLSESGTDIPIYDVTLSQFMYASNAHTAQEDAISVLAKVESQAADHGPDRHQLRSRSLTRDCRTEANWIQDRMKNTVDFIKKGFKSNMRGSVIQDSFVTLEKALREIPESIGFNIELKYPRIHEALGANFAPVAIDINVYIDTILSVIFRFAGNRNIILSSFTPEVCILLMLKQKAYPVLFITNAGRQPIDDKERRTESLQVAVRFATQWGLAGLVFATEVLAMCPRLVGYVKSKGHVCGSYGVLNNEPEIVKLQVKADVDLIIADKVGLISNALRDMPS